MFCTKIDIVPGAKATAEFVAKSPFGADDSKWEAAIKFCAFLRDLDKFLAKFKQTYAPGKEPYKLVVGLIHQNSDIVKMVKSGSDLLRRNPKYSTRIEIVNVITVEESGPQCGDIAAGKIMVLLKKLDKIPDVKHKNGNNNVSISWKYLS